MNVKSSQMGAKDIVKIEGRELESRELDKIALIAPNATINIVREYEIVEKGQVKLLNNVKGILKCPNPNCITNTAEPVISKFQVINTDPLCSDATTVNVSRTTKILKHSSNEQTI